MADENVLTPFDLPPRKRMLDRPTPVRIKLTALQSMRLRRAASRRRISTNQLMTQIVATVLDHDIIDAVLDDAN